MAKSLQKIEIHKFEKFVGNSFKSAKKQMSSKNYQLFEKYDKSMIADTMAIATRQHQLEILLRLTRKMNKDWDTVTKEDIDNLVYEIMKESSTDGKENWNTWDNKKILRVFMRWLKFGNRDFKKVGDPEEIKNVKMKKVKNKLVRESLLTDEDISKMLTCMVNPRDRALFSVQAEAGCRPGEVLSLRIKHVKIDQYGAKIAVDGKTGARSIRIVKAVPDLMKWLDIHPFKDDEESPLWIVLQQGDRYGKSLDWFASKYLLNKYVKLGGIKKRVYLNLFRHSSATKSAQFMTESQLRMRQGWTPASTMPATYVHMIGADADNAYLEHLGIKIQSKNEIGQVPKMCHICKSPNSIESEICNQCGKPLDIESATKLDERNASELSEMIKQAVAQEMQRENHYLRNRIEELESRKN